jgi:aryl-alcohol dehydrogenase-like predicted oxidoreductase
MTISLFSQSLFALDLERAIDTTAKSGYDAIELACCKPHFDLERLRRARDLGAELSGVLAIQIALAWLLHKPFPLLPVVGPCTPRELASCADACSISLSPAQCAWLNLET